MINCDEEEDMRIWMRSWELPPDFIAQIKPSIRLFFCPVFSWSSSFTYCTHIPSSPTNSHKILARPVQSFQCLFLALLSIRFVLSLHPPFPQASFCSSLPPQPPNFLLLAQSWPGLPVLFLASLSLPLCLCSSGDFKRRPHSTPCSFPLAKHGQKKTSQTPLLKKSSPPLHVQHVTHTVSMQRPQQCTHSSVRLDCRDMWRFMGRG